MLVTCPECKEKVSSSASSCPHCGCPEPWRNAPEVEETLKRKVKEEFRKSSKCPHCGHTNKPKSYISRQSRDTGRIYADIYSQCDKCKSHYSSGTAYLD